MGTDASALVEVMRNGKWEPMVERVWPNMEAESFKEAFDRVPIISRNYQLFSVLADVRNKSGRGKKTMMKHHVEGYGEIEFEYDTDDGGHDTLEYIAEPRGIPDDCSDIWRKFATQDQFHDQTFLTLDELLDEEAPVWKQYVYHQAIVPEDEYVEYMKSGTLPKIHSRGAGGPGMRVVNEVEYAAGVRGRSTTSIDFHWRGGTVGDEAGLAWWAIVGVMGMVSQRASTSARLMLAFDS